MNPPIKKIAIIFLLCATVTSSLSFGTSLFINRSPAKANSSKISKVLESAFVKTNKTGDFLSGGGQNGENMTDQATDLFAQELVKLNPEGPEVKDGLIVGIVSPQQASFDEYFKNNPPSSTVLVPVLEESRIRSIEAPTQSDVVHYLNAVTQIQSKVSSDPYWQSVIATSSIPTESINEGGKILTEAKDDMYDTKVPDPFLELHRSLLSFLHTTASYSNMVTVDPVAAAALSQDLQSVINKETLDIDTAQKKLLKDLPELVAKLPPGDDRPALAKFFGVQNAYATFPTIDYVHIATSIAEWAKSFGYYFIEIATSMALSYLKDKLLKKITDKVIGWAKGAGAPQFVTNWLVLQSKSAQRSADNFISQRISGICGNAATGRIYGSIIASALGSPSEEDSGSGADTEGDPVGCPVFDTPDVNQPNERTYFGWNGFLNATIYSPWNDLLSIADEAKSVAIHAAEAKVREAVSGNGFLDQKKCDEGSGSDTGDCAPGVFSQIKTFGSTIGASVSKSVNALVDDIASIENAKMLAATAAKLLVSSLFEKIDNGGVLTNPISENQRINPPPPSGSTLQQQLTSYGSSLDKALQLTTIALSNLQSAASSFNNALQICTDGNSPAIIQDQLEQIATLSASLNTKKDAIQALINIVEDFKKNPSAHTSQELVSRVGTPTAIQKLESDAAKNELDSRAIIQSAGDIIASCA